MADLLSIFCKMLDKLAIANEYIQTPTIIHMIAKALSYPVSGLISPYPTVVKVWKAQ